MTPKEKDILAWLLRTCQLVARNGRLVLWWRYRAEYGVYTQDAIDAIYAVARKIGAEVQG